MPLNLTKIGLKNYLHTLLEKSLIERVMEYFKDMTEGFDDYYPCINNNNCDLEYVYNCITLFIIFYNNNRIKNIFSCIQESEFILT